MTDAPLISPVLNIDLDEPKEDFGQLYGKPEDRGDITFYCKDCNKIVPAEKIGIKYSYKCKECSSKNVAFGTESSIKKFFHIQENPLLNK